MYRKTNNRICTIFGGILYHINIILSSGSVSSSILSLLSNLGSALASIEDALSAIRLFFKGLHALIEFRWWQLLQPFGLKIWGCLKRLGRTHICGKKTGCTKIIQNHPKSWFHFTVRLWSCQTFISFPPCPRLAQPHLSMLCGRLGIQCLETTHLDITGSSLGNVLLTSFGPILVKWFPIGYSRYSPFLALILHSWGRCGFADSSRDNNPLCPMPNSYLCGFKNPWSQLDPIFCAHHFMGDPQNYHPWRSNWFPIWDNSCYSML